jgi:predicted phosphodiesterase
MKITTNRFEEELSEAPDVEESVFPLHPDDCPQSPLKKILFTADLHLNIPARNKKTGGTALDSFAEILEVENPDAVVIAGDISMPDRAAAHIEAIRQVVGARHLAVTLGNHDFWIKYDQSGIFHDLDQIVDEFWVKPCRDHGVTLLDRENLILEDIALVGGYGHFDLGHGWPNLTIKGVRITEEIYLSGGMGRVYWNDFRYIPDCGSRLQVESRKQAAGIATRLDQAIKSEKRILMATHTCPWAALNGHPRTGAESDILTAYCGNSLLGRELEKRAASIEFLMCGHTHMPVREQKIHGITCLNIGADYGIFRGVIYETANRTIRWL